jgi:hypothetical protein
MKIKTSTLKKLIKEVLLEISSPPPVPPQANKTVSPESTIYMFLTSPGKPTDCRAARDAFDKIQANLSSGDRRDLDHVIMMVDSGFSGDVDVAGAKEILKKSKAKTR